MRQFSDNHNKVKVVLYLSLVPFSIRLKRTKTIVQVLRHPIKLLKVALLL